MTTSTDTGRPSKASPGSITGGSITGGSITGGSITGGSITGGSITGGSITGGSCHKYQFCRDKHVFVATGIQPCQYELMAALNISVEWSSEEESS